MKLNKYQQKIVQGIKQAAKVLNKPEAKVTKKDLINAGGVTDWTMKMSGGISSIKNEEFKAAIDSKMDKIETAEANNYIKALETAVAKKQSLDEAILKAIKETIKPLPKPTKPLTKTKATKKKRELVAMLNDTHYGLVVDPEEVDMINKYSWEEACRRTAYFVSEVSNYKHDKRDETKKLNLILNGDLIQGIIHGLTSRTMELWVHQMNGATHILTHTIAQLASKFEEVEVHAITGNHEELPHKREGGHRVTQEHYDSFSNAIFYSLSIAFRNYSNVKFNIPKTPYAFFNLPAGRAMAAHGHNLFTKQLGNPGRTINVKLLSDEIRNFNAGERLKGREPVKLILFGHTHSYAHFITSDGVEVYVAPCLSGLDPYAHQLTINTSFIAQTVFESTDKYILGDSRLVRLQEADGNKELDKIIPIYKNELKWKKEK